MNHLEETLETLLSRGENLMLDSKVRKQSFNIITSGSLLWFLCARLCVPPQVPELLSALLLAEQKIGCSLRWRLHEKLLQRYNCLARLLPGELLYQNFSPRIFTILTTNVSTTLYYRTGQVREHAGKLSFWIFQKVLPVQKEAARTFCTFLRYNRKPEQRQEMMGQLLKGQWNLGDLRV